MNKKIERRTVIFFLLSIFFISSTHFAKGAEFNNIDIQIRTDNTQLSLKEPLNVKITYLNNGDFEISPDIHINMENGDDISYKTIEPFPSEFTPVKPHSSLEFPLQISTIGLPQGKYVIHFDFYQGGEQISNQVLALSLVSTPSQTTSLLTTLIKLKNSIPLSSLTLLIIFLVGLTTFTFYLFNRINKKSQTPSYQEFLKFDK